MPTESVILQEERPPARDYIYSKKVECNTSGGVKKASGIPQEPKIEYYFARALHLGSVDPQKIEIEN